MPGTTAHSFVDDGVAPETSTLMTRPRHGGESQPSLAVETYSVEPTRVGPPHTRLVAGPVMIGTAVAASAPSPRARVCSTPSSVTEYSRPLALSIAGGATMPNPPGIAQLEVGV